MSTSTDLNLLKVPELRDILRDGGQPVGGLKSQLIARIMATGLRGPSTITANSSRIPKPPPPLSKASKKPPQTQTPVPNISAELLPLPIPSLPSPAQISSSITATALPRLPSPPRSFSPPRLLSPTQMEMSFMAPASVLGLIYEHLPILITQNQPERILSSQYFIWDITGPLVEARMVNPEFNRLEQEFRIVARGSPESNQLQIQMDQTPVGLPFDSEYRQRLVQPILINQSAAYVYGLPGPVPGIGDTETYNGDFYLKFGTTDRTLTYWQLLRGIERYLQWYLRFFQIGARKYWTDLRYMGIHNGIPVLRLELSK